MSAGSWFQACGPALEKALEPNITVKQLYFLANVTVSFTFTLSVARKHQQQTSVTVHHVTPEVTVDTLNHNCQVSTTKVMFSLSYKFWQTTRIRRTHSHAFSLLKHTIVWKKLQRKYRQIIRNAQLHTYACNCILSAKMQHYMHASDATGRIQIIIIYLTGSMYVSHSLIRSLTSNSSLINGTPIHSVSSWCVYVHSGHSHGISILQPSGLQQTTCPWLGILVPLPYELARIQTLGGCGQSLLCYD